MSELPSGTVTFLFTDVEGSTALVQNEAIDGKRELIRTQDLVRQILVRQGGHEVHCAGDGFFFAFGNAFDAVDGALQLQAELAGGAVQVRVGLHTGHAERWNGEYMGIDVHRAARISAAAHGGQILMSRSTRELVSCDTVDLGQHRLRDIAERLHLFQVGLQPFAPVASLGRSNLPAPLTPFVGRAREIDAIGRIFDVDGVRLVTLTGPGGIGKTTLATELARRRFPRQPGGSWWIDLAAIAEGDLVPEAISKVIGSHRDDIAEFLGQRKCALVLDNFEHVQQASGFVGELLRRCENLEILVTSRAPLRLASEWRFAVDPLSEPDAIVLFCTRARAAGVFVKRSEQVAAICRRVQNVPLALELAAAKTVSLSPFELLARLDTHLFSLSSGADDLPERHRTLRATVQWSYDLLDAHERCTFCKLAVFAGGWSAEMARTVFGADLDAVDDLIRKSFVRFTNGRYGMLEVIRKFGLEQLAADVALATSAWGLYCGYFLDVVEHQDKLQTASPLNWRKSFDALEKEHDNIHAALMFSAQPSQAPHGHARALRFCAALNLYWTSRWHCREGLRLSLLVLDGCRDDSNQAAVAGTLWAAAGLSTSVGEVDRAASLYEAALAVLEKQELPETQAMVISDFGHLSYLLGDFDTAKRRFSQLERLALAHGDEKLIANARYGIARVALAQGDTSIARDNLEIALAGYVKIGHRSNQALAHLYWGVLALAESDADAAERHLCRALALARETGETIDQSRILRSLADFEAARGNFRSARLLLRDSLLSNVESEDMFEVALGLRSAAMLSFREGEPAFGAMLLGASARAGTRFERLLGALLSPTDALLIETAKRLLVHEFDVHERKGTAMNTSAAIEAVLRETVRKPRGATARPRQPARSRDRS